MVLISNVSKSLICDVATKLIDIGIDFEYQIKDNCILIDRVTKNSVLYILSPLGVTYEDVFEE